MAVTMETIDTGDDPVFSEPDEEVVLAPSEASSDAEERSAFSDASEEVLLAAPSDSEEELELAPGQVLDDSDSEEELELAAPPARKRRGRQPPSRKPRGGGGGAKAAAAAASPRKRAPAAPARKPRAAQPAAMCGDGDSTDTEEELLPAVKRERAGSDSSGGRTDSEPETAPFKLKKAKRAKEASVAAADDDAGFVPRPLDDEDRDSEIRKGLRKKSKSAAKIRAWLWHAYGPKNRGMSRLLSWPEFMDFITSDCYGTKPMSKSQKCGDWVDLQAGNPYRWGDCSLMQEVLVDAVRKKGDDDEEEEEEEEEEEGDEDGEEDAVKEVKFQVHPDIVNVYLTDPDLARR